MNQRKVMGVDVHRCGICRRNHAYVAGTEVIINDAIADMHDEKAKEIAPKSLEDKRKS